MHSGTFLKTFAVAAVTVAGIGIAQAADQPKPFIPYTPAASASPSWDLLFGVTATSQYISRGVAQSSGFAIQPWAEFDVGPVYVGYWGSNTDPALTLGSWEHDLMVGVRVNPGPLALDAGYVRYIYDTGDAGGEIYLKGSITPIMPLTIGAAVFYNPDAATTYVEGNGKLMLTDKFSVSGAVGSQDGTMSWNAGLTFAANDWISLDGRYHSGPTSNKFVFSVAFATSLHKLTGGKY
jgi:uncharacterized protein (TIGR02001 family)